jgi:RHS repeat-associated protein
MVAGTRLTGVWRRRANRGYAYTAREWDPETNLYYYRARYYHPKVGRFISEDPIGLEGGINLYAYVENATTTWTDPGGTLSRGREYECGPCTFQFDNDPTKGRHVHWWCPGQPQGCAYPDGRPCDNSQPVPPRIRDCVRKIRPDWFPCESVPDPTVCGPACQLGLFILGTMMIIYGMRGGMVAQPAGAFTPVPGPTDGA